MLYTIRLTGVVQPLTTPNACIPVLVLILLTATGGPVCSGVTRTIILSFLKNKNMATFNKGILGGFSGKTGSVIGSNWKGRTVMRSLPGKRSKAPTQVQLDQQEKFKLVVGFLSG